MERRERLERMARSMAVRRIDWDDLRYVVAVAESGSLTEASSSLRVNRTTVLRRINAFERKHGVRLFERLRTGFAPTSAGREILAAARSLEGTIAAVERKLAGHDLQLSGAVNLTTTDTLMASILSGVIASFQRAHPQIAVNVSVSNRLLDLSTRDADVAVRPVAEPPQTVIGRRICTVAFAVYASSGFHSAAGDLLKEPWIAPDEALMNTSVARWMRHAVPEARCVHRVDSMLAMRELCAVGAGLAALPCYLGDADPRLTRVQPPVKGMSTALWVLTHQDLIRTARVRAFVDYVATGMSAERELIEGRRIRL